MACAKGYGGIVNTILSNKIFQVLANGGLIYMLLHMDLIRTFFFSFHEPFEVNLFFLVGKRNSGEHKIQIYSKIWVALFLGLDIYLHSILLP